MNQIASLFGTAIEKHRQGQLSEAIAIFEMLASIAPQDPDLLFMLAICHAEMEQYDQSVRLFDRLLHVKPNDVNSLINRAVALKNLGRYEKAIEGFERAIRIDDKIAAAYANKGNALFECKQISAAIENYTKAIEIDPNYQDAYLNRGIALLDLNLTDEALLDFNRAIFLGPNDPEAYFNKALLLILLGKFKEGWELYEWRMLRVCSRDKYPDFNSLSWRGKDSLKGKKILVYSEQGFGDIIQFCRYLPKLDEIGADVIFEVPLELMSLVSTIKCSMTITQKGSMLPDFDAYCPLMSLPYAFQTSIESIPAEVPYLYADENKSKVWNSRIGPNDRLQVGLVWSGSSVGPYRLKNRSIKLDALTQILDMPIQFHSLQKEHSEKDLGVIDCYPNLVRHEADLRDFSDTAALIACLDLVITVDTSVAHLAGAMGKPVWIMLRYESDFRWMLHRSDSPWYPSARLFRQNKSNDWRTVVDEIGRSLSGMIEF